MIIGHLTTFPEPGLLFGSILSEPGGIVITLVLAYLIGAIPCGYLLGRMRGIDLRSVGSGNIGASNATRELGTKLGLIVFAADVLKAALVPWILHSIAPQVELQWVAAAGFAAFLGHIYPVYLGFRGGKGVACALGVCLVLVPAAGLCAFFLYLQTLWLTRTSAVGSLTSVSMMSLFVLQGGQAPATQLTIVAMSLIIWWRHKSNLAELMAEHRKKKQNKARMQER